MSFLIALVMPLVARAEAPPEMTVAELPIPGDPRFVRLARDVFDAAASVDPALASNAGLVDDAIRVPHYDEAHVRALEKRLDRDLKKLARLPWRSWDVHAQVDFRWIYAVAETTRRAVVVERLWTHRPGQWLEPVANDLIALAAVAPERPELQDRVLDEVPAMLEEMKAVCTEPTRRDVATAIELAEALSTMAESRGRTATVAALDGYVDHLNGLSPTREFAVIGAENYAWRLKHALLLPWTPDQLLEKAEEARAVVEAELAALPPPDPVPEPGPEQLALAAALDRTALLGMYDAIEVANREATIAGGWVTVPDAVGAIRARETPDAMVPLTGDGGSMNPPPTYRSTNVGWWNVEHFREAWTPEERLAKVVAAQSFRTNRLGPYSAHEGFPGHHLQLSIARTHPDPLRSILPDPLLNEGWALYAEEVFEAHGGLGDGARANLLRSYLFRIKRVTTDVNVETGRWDLQQAADFKYGPGSAVDEDILRAIQWPTQLVCYFSGKAQILELRDAARAAQGAAWDERAFHDAVLGAGSIPLALVRAEMLGEPVPGIE